MLDTRSPSQDVSLPEPRGLRLLVVSDVRLYREGLVQTLREHLDVTALETAATAEEAVAAARRTQPDVVVVDMAASRRHDTLRVLHERLPGARIVVFGISEVDDDVLTCAEHGIAGLVARDGTLSELVTAISCAARGEMHCSPRMASVVFRRLADLATHRAPARDAEVAQQLTRRELEIVVCLHQGLSNKEIAHRLNIEYATVKNHVHHVLEKLQLRRRSEVATHCPVVLDPARPAVDVEVPVRPALQARDR